MVVLFLAAVAVVPPLEKSKGLEIRYWSSYVIERKRVDQRLVCDVNPTEKFVKLIISYWTNCEPTILSRFSDVVTLLYYNFYNIRLRDRRQRNGRLSGENAVSIRTDKDLRLLHSPTSNLKLPGPFLQLAKFLQPVQSAKHVAILLGSATSAANLMRRTDKSSVLAELARAL
jgi:hypothetical protein